MSDIDSRNEAARRRAQEAGRATYVSEIVYLEPTCVECAQRIAGPHLSFRTCGCPGVVWRNSYHPDLEPWTRETTGEHVDV